MKFRVASALFAVLLLAGCGQEAPEESPEGNATQSPDGSAADADLKVTVNGEELPLDSHICATYDHKTVLTAYFENMLPALAIDLEGDEISNITLWDPNDSDRHHSWGVNYYGSDPVAKVTQDRWVFDAVVREYELYDQGNLETLEIHAEFDCGSPEANEAIASYDSMPDGEYGPGERRKTQLEPLDDLLAKDRSTVIFDGQELPVVEQVCEAGALGDHRVDTHVDYQGELVQFQWEFTDPKIPEAVSWFGSANSQHYGWQLEQSSYPHIDTEGNTHALRGFLYSNDLSEKAKFEAAVVCD